MTTTNGKWIPDPENLKCRHDGSNIEVVFEQQGTTFIGKLNALPIDLMDAWAADHNGAGYIRQAVREAEEAFLRAYAETYAKRF
ncbi:MAG: hypothetical protein FWG89_07950 [Treponema sp.]|nr:hypothetical protein [Treponema sp.]